MPCIFLIQYCFMTLGVKLGNKVGPRITTLISFIFMLLAYLLMILFPNYYIVLISFGIFGLGDGLGNLSVIKNCWKYFPNNIALVTGIIIGGLGISSAVLTPLADFVIINPKKIEPQNEIYPKEVANNLVNYLYFLLALFSVLGITSVFLTFDYKEEKECSNDIQMEENTALGEEKNEEKNKNEVSENMKNNSLGLLLEGFLSWTNLILLSFCFCGPCKNIVFYNILPFNTYSLLLHDYKYK